MHKAVNGTLVTLIPKNLAAKAIKYYSPISCCSTIYKVIAKIMTLRLGKVLSHIVSKSQAAFVQGQKIHDHIYLTYELING